MISDLSKELYEHLDILHKEVDEDTWDASFDYVVNVLTTLAKIARAHDSSGESHAYFIAAQSFQINYHMQRDGAIVPKSREPESEITAATDTDEETYVELPTGSPTGRNGRDALLELIKRQDDDT